MKRKGLAGILAAMLLLSGCATNIDKGVEYLEEGKYEEAITAFEMELSEEKNLDEANRGIGIAYFELENYEEAIVYLKKALENEAEKTASIYQLLATSCMYCEDYEGAIENYDFMLDMEDCTEEMEQEALFNRIAAFEKMADWDAAKDAVSRYLAKYPEDERAIKEAQFLETR